MAMNESTKVLLEILNMEGTWNKEARYAMTETYFQGPYEVEQTESDRVSSLEEFVHHQIEMTFPTFASKLLARYTDDVDWTELARNFYNPEEKSV